jgi:hypothetical protein
LKIIFANNYTTPGGRVYKAGTTAEVNDADARSLIVRGKARRTYVTEDSASAETQEVTNEEADHG